MIRALAVVLTSLLVTGLGVAEDAEPTAQQEPPADIALDVVSDTVTGTLQGQDGLRIQTLCTHCNSANIQVGGLCQEFAPVIVDGYPVIGGLATSILFSVMPADTVINATVQKGPGSADAPSQAAGGRIMLDEARPDELPLYDATVESGTYDRYKGSVRFAGSLSERIEASLVGGRERVDSVDDDGDGTNDVGSVDRSFAGGRIAFDVGRGHTLDVGASWIDEEDIDGRGAFDWFGYADPMTSRVSWTREDAIFDREEYRVGWEWKRDGGDRLEVRLLDATRDQTLRSELEDPSGEFSHVLYDRFTIVEDNHWGVARYLHGIGLKGRLEGGIEWQEQVISAETLEGNDILLNLQFPGVFDDPVPQPGTDSVETWSGFLGLDWSFSPRWALSGGARYDDATWKAKIVENVFFPMPMTTTRTEERERSRVSPRATLRFSPKDAWTFKLVVGETFRTPTPILAAICCGQSYQRNVNTDAETGVSYGLESIYQPSPELRISTFMARNEFDDHILRLVGWSQRFIQTYALANVSRTRADTAEVAIRWSPYRWLSLDGSMGWLAHENTGNTDVTVMVTPPSFSDPIPVVIPINRVPYQPVRTASAAATVTLPGGASITGQAGYTGSMRIQQFEDPLTSINQNTLLAEMRQTPGFWIANVSFTAPIGEHLGIVGGVSNLTDRLQNDLGDPTTDYNWGPLTGISWRLGLRYYVDR